LFQEAPEYPSGANSAVKVVVADLNGDGIQDAIIANGCNGCSNGAVGVLLGIGDGAFQPPVTYSTGGLYPNGLAVGDINGDGKPDVVVVNNGSSTVAVLLGNGDGTFQPAVTYPSGGGAGSQSFGVALADINIDGKLDVIVGNSTGSATGNVAVLLGLGDGTFGPAVTYNAGGSPYSPVVSDVNGDGKPDLIVPNYCTVFNGDLGLCQSGSVGVLLGNGNGTFLPVVTYSTAANVTSAAVGDVNGDGKLDIVVGSSTGVQLLLGNGNGTFQAAVTLVSYAALEVQFVSLADVNGDGKLDLLAVASNQMGPGSLVVMLGNGNGTFQPEKIFSSVGYGSTSLAVADLNADTKLDVLTTNICASNGNSDPLLCTAGSLAVLLGNGDGTFRGAPEYYNPSDLFTGQTYSTQVIAAGDLNRDGKADLVVSYPGTNLGGKPQLEVLLNSGNGTFGAPTPTIFALLATAVSVGDVNNDGKLDLIAGSGCTSGFTYCQANNLRFGSVAVQLGNGDGTFTSGTAYQTGGTVVTSIAVADVNGDGKPDLLVANTCSLDTNCTNGVISVLLGTGNGSFQQPVDYSSGGQGTLSIAVSDVNGDGHPDLIVTNGGCGDYGYCAVVPYLVSVLLGNGDGTFQPAVSYATGGMSPVAVVVGDMNGDGKPDLVVGNNACPGIDRQCGNANVAVLLGNGDGTFQTPLTASVPGLWDGNLVLADFNGDGKLDVAGAGQGSADFVLLGNGDGTFQPSVDVGAAWPGVVAADLTGQGKPSLVFGGGLTALLPPVSVLEPTTTALTSLPNPSTFGQVVTFNVAVRSASMSYPGTPTGTVNFFVGGFNIGASNLDNNGNATLATAGLPEGNDGIVAVYHGDSNFAPSTSPVLNQSVIGPTAVPAPTSLNFPNQKLATASASQTVQVTNTGSVALTITSMQITGVNAGDFTVGNSSCNAPLAAGLTCVIDMIFTPSNYGNRVATLTITDNAPGSPQSVALSGTANVPGVHFVAVGSSAMFNGFALATYNDLIKGKSLTSAAPTGHCPVGDTCLGLHWSIPTGSAAAYCKDTRTNTTLASPANQNGNLWIDWVEDVTTSVAVDTWAYLSADSTVGLRCFLARPQAALVLTALEGTPGGNAVPSRLFADGSGDTTLDVAIFNVFNQPAGIAFSAAMTDVRPEDGLLATQRSLGSGNASLANGCSTTDASDTDATPLDPYGLPCWFIYSFALGYGNPPYDPGTGANVAGIGNPILSGEPGSPAAAQPVLFGLPGYNDPLSGVAVPSTIQTYAVGEAPIVFIANRSNVTTGLGQPIASYVAGGNCYGTGLTSCQTDNTGQPVGYTSDGSYYVRNVWDQHPWPMVDNVYPALGGNASLNGGNDPSGNGICTGLWNAAGHPSECHVARRPLGNLFASGDCEGDNSSFTWPLAPFNTQGLRAQIPNRQAFPITLFVQEPLSGGYNTTEFSEVRRYGTPGGSMGSTNVAAVPPITYAAGDTFGRAPYISQETYVYPTMGDQALNKQCLADYGEVNVANEGYRIRGIGTGEVLNGPGGTAVGDGVLNTPDSLAYAFFSFGNVSKLALSNNYGYVMINGVEPLFDNYENATPNAAAPAGHAPVTTANGNNVEGEPICEGGGAVVAGSCPFSLKYPATQEPGQPQSGILPSLEWTTVPIARPDCRVLTRTCETVLTRRGR
jgi:hypothetical protein